MKPAFSVIFFTTLSGLGYGLAFWLLLEQAVSGLSVWRGGVGIALAFALILVGLMSSTLHLGHPERAWRAMSQWRTSWLSREGVAALVSLPPIAAVWLATVMGLVGPLWLILAVLGAIAAVATVYCTGMIYQSLKPVAAWTSGLTTPVYLAYAAQTGGFAAAALAAWFGDDAPWRAAPLVLLSAGLWGMKLAYWRRQAETPGLTPEAATGLGGLGKVRQLEAPHVTENYITREMGFQVARRHADRLRAITLWAGLALPGACALVAVSMPITAAVSLTAGAAFALLGAIIERWIFFAEARHSVMAFYGNN